MARRSRQDEPGSRRHVLPRGLAGHRQCAWGPIETGLLRIPAGQTWDPFRARLDLRFPRVRGVSVYPAA